ncbi:MAG: cysteine desulfurase [Chlorobi bacterium]|nr:cysteine desulfurase [Chlorobiota bacterium]
MALNIEQIRKDFPILSRKVNGKPLVYLDNAATTQKPVGVMERITRYYSEENSNVHRGVHRLSQVATEEFEEARRYIAGFIGAGKPEEIVFTRGTTESVNFIATVFQQFIGAGDEILITAMEHHSNLVPWQQLCRRQNAAMKVVPVNERGELDMESFKNLITSKTKMVAVAHVSNVLGTINPVEKITGLAHDKGVPVLVDGAQAIAHLPVDVRRTDCDFYAFSAHKAYGPMGIGVLYGKEEWLNKLSPYQFGGEMVDQVGFKETTFNVLPFKFEAGTPDVCGALAMETALKYIEKNGIENIRQHEDELLEYATRELKKLRGIKIIGEAAEKTAVLSFVAGGVHPYDLGTLVDQMGVAVRTGHHCAQPLVERFGLSGTVRASFGIYNTFEEVDIFIRAVRQALDMLR